MQNTIPQPLKFFFSFLYLSFISDVRPLFFPFTSEVLCFVLIPQYQKSPDLTSLLKVSSHSLIQSISCCIFVINPHFSMVPVFITVLQKKNKKNPDF